MNEAKDLEQPKGVETSTGQPLPCNRLFGRARWHAQRIIDNYTSNGLGDPRRSDDHAVATAVAYLDLLELLRPMTPSEAEAAYAAAPDVPISAERIEEIMRYVRERS